jgi:formylglycine-generating enzyme required for sulfatase activity
MTAELSPRERWERAAGELRAFRDLQRQTWGEIDNAILGRYLAGEVTAVERELVEATLQRHPELRELLALIGESLPMEVPQSAAAAVLQPSTEDSQLPGPARASDLAPEHAGTAATARSVREQTATAADTPVAATQVGVRRQWRRLAMGVALAASLLLLLGVGREVFVARRAQALLDRLLEARTEDVPAIIADMAPYRRRLDGPLHRAYAEAEAKGDARKQLHVSLALLPVDANQVEYLYGRLLALGPPEVIVIREALRPRSGELAERLWALLEDTRANPGRRLRAACALAAYTPDDGRWKKVSGDVASRLVAENSLVIGEWAEALRPVRRALLPPLAGLLADEGRGAAERRAITRLYGGYAEDVPNAFAPLDEVLTEGTGPDATAEARLALARRQANTAMALVELGRWETVWPLLRHTPDPTLRSYLIDRIGPSVGDARAVIDRLKAEPDDSARRALLLALGEFDQGQLPPDGREALMSLVLAWYRGDPDPGIHGAAGWLLGRWGQGVRVEEIDGELATGKPEGSRRWYVNGQRQTLVVIPGPVTVPRGSPPTEDGREGGAEGKVERRHVERIGRSFAIAAREVTVAEFRRFRGNHDYDKAAAPTADCPVTMVSWYDAAAYCNWLSAHEGIPEAEWCYLPNDKGQYAAGMKVAPDFLSRAGYRLPTGAEAEFACRAGSVTAWSMGEAEDLLGKYAWYIANSASRSRPVGSLRPNDLGLFDLHGNVSEWCEDRLAVGGDFISPPKNVRSGSRSSNTPDKRSEFLGFRPARTYR